MNRGINMLDGFVAMAMELALGVHHMFARMPQFLDRIVDARVGWHHRGSRRNCRWRLGSGSHYREGQS